MSLDQLARLSPSLAISETGFVFDPRTGHSFTVNPTGLVVLRALRAARSIGDIVEELGREFTGAAPLADDVVGFVRQLEGLGLAVTGRGAVER
jgi:hypothetical protein